MFGLDEYSSLTWDSAAWIYSVIIGVVLARYFMFIANPITRAKGYQILLSIPSFYAGNHSWFIRSMVYGQRELHKH